MVVECIHQAMEVITCLEDLMYVIIACFVFELDI